MATSSFADGPHAAGRPLPAQTRLIAGGWDPLKPPFRALATGLADAEGDLNDTGGSRSAERWEPLARVIGNPSACTQALNDVLAGLGLGLRLSGADPGWRVVITGAPDVATDEVRAAHAVALLVEAGGWARLKRCQRRDCSRTFLDATNAGTRTRCRLHVRSRRNR